MEKSREVIAALSLDVSEATKALKGARVEMVKGERDTMEMKRGRVLREAKEIQMDRTGEWRGRTVLSSYELILVW